MNDTECAFGQFCRFEPGTCGGTGSCINAPDVRHDTRDVVVRLLLGKPI